MGRVQVASSRGSLVCLKWCASPAEPQSDSRTTSRGCLCTLRCYSIQMTSVQPIKSALLAGAGFSLSSTIVLQLNRDRLLLCPCVSAVPSSVLMALQLTSFVLAATGDLQPRLYEPPGLWPQTSMKDPILSNRSPFFGVPNNITGIRCLRSKQPTKDNRRSNYDQKREKKRKLTTPYPTVLISLTYHSCLAPVPPGIPFAKSPCLVPNPCRRPTEPPNRTSVMNQGQGPLPCRSPLQALIIVVKLEPHKGLTTFRGSPYSP